MKIWNIFHTSFNIILINYETIRKCSVEIMANYFKQIMKIANIMNGNIFKNKISIDNYNSEAISYCKEAQKALDIMKISIKNNKYCRNEEIQLTLDQVNFFSILKLIFQYSIKYIDNIKSSMKKRTYLMYDSTFIENLQSFLKELKLIDSIFDHKENISNKTITTLYPTIIVFKLLVSLEKKSLFLLILFHAIFLIKESNYRYVN